MRILAIIPARGGSKGLPGKNVRPLCGKPLLAYSIEAALHCRYVDRVVVSTESQGIAKVAVQHGAEAPFLRTTDLSGDKADLGQVIGDALWRLANMGYTPDAHIVLVPTSPFRTKGLMDHLCRLLELGHRSVNTVRRVPSTRLFTLGPQSLLSPLPQIDFGPQLRSYGILSGHNKRGHLPSVVLPINDPRMLIDIDSPVDFELAEALLRTGSFCFDNTEMGND
jgi:CMP-N-acetylneuraminic acid synthetase